MKGVYFNITGPDGAGKDTIIDKVSSLLKSKDVIYFREPGGTMGAEQIRDVILSDEGELEKNFGKINYDIIMKESIFLVEEARKHFESGNIASMEVNLFAAARNEVLKKIVEEGLDNDKIMFGSRSISCSMAYQGEARGLGMEEVWDINEKILTTLPDFEIHLIVDQKTTEARLANRTGKQDRLDKEEAEFHELTRKGYKKFYELEKFPVYFVDASKSIDEVTRDVLDILKSNGVF